MLINLPKYEFRTGDEFCDINWGHLTPLYRHKYVNKLNEEEHVSAFVNITYGSVEYIANGDICSVPIFNHLNLLCKESGKLRGSRVREYLAEFNLPLLDTFIFKAFIDKGLLKTFFHLRDKDKKELYLMDTNELIEFIYLNEIKKFYIMVFNDNRKGYIHYAFEDLFLINLWEPQKKYVKNGYNNFVIYYFEFYN